MLQILQFVTTYPAFAHSYLICIILYHLSHSYICIYINRGLKQVEKWSTATVGPHWPKTCGPLAHNGPQLTEPLAQRGPTQPNPTQPNPTQPKPTPHPHPTPLFMPQISLFVPILGALPKIF